MDHFTSGTVLALVLLTGLVAAVAVFIVAARAKRAQRAARAQFIAAYRFPAELTLRFHAQRPGLSDEQGRHVLEGLRQYFLACLAAQGGGIARQLGMPSRAVDEVWHEFIVMTRDYAAFCTRAFGKYLHHTPERQMTEPTKDALANTLHQLKKPELATALAMAGAMPLVFAMDRELGLKDGYLYDNASFAELERKRQMMLASNGGDAATGNTAFEGDCAAGSTGCGDGGGGGGGGGGCGGGGGS